MKILAISEHYISSKAAGTITYVMNICRELAKQGHHLYLIGSSLSEHPDVGKWVNQDGYNLYLIKAPGKRTHTTRFERRYFTYITRRILKDCMRSFNPDVVHIMCGHQVPQVMRSLPLSLPKLWTIQTVPPKEYGFTKLTSFPILNKVGKQLYFGLAGFVHARRLRKYNYDKLVCPSECTKQSALDAGVEEDKIEVIPHGVDTETFKPIINIRKVKQELGTTGYPLLLTVAGIAPHKGQIDVINALPDIIKRYPDAHFLNIGPIRSNDYYESLVARIQDLKLTRNCSFLHGIERAQLVKYYNACDVYLQPSYQEGFCMAILEAISCGKRVIGTATGAIPDFLSNSENGFLIKSGDIHQLKESIDLVLNYPINETGRVLLHEYVVERYSWEAVAQRTLDVYQELISSKEASK